MPFASRKTFVQVTVLLASLLILKTVGGVILSYADYFPPHFEADFLLGREAYFFGAYQWAFYLHIVAGPVSLVLGLLLMAERHRACFPRWHRRLGRIQGVVVVLLVAPAGFWMALYAEGGPVAGLGFALLAIFTALTMALGWRAAVRCRFAEHRVWMWRCYLLLCSAVVIRVIGGVATVLGTQAPWIYPFSAWASWLLPLVVYELARAVNAGSTRRETAQAW